VRLLLLCRLGWAVSSLVLVGAGEGPKQAPESGVIDRLVALVAGRTITLSELEFEARVALIQRGGMEAARAPLNDQALRSALDLAIGERLETEAADKLQAFHLEESEIESAVRDFRSKFRSDSELARFLARHEADEQQLAAVLARRLRAEKILDSKISLKARVSDAEVRRFYDEHRSELGGSFDEVRSSIREKLVRERYAALAREELRQIRKGADVRMIAPFARQRNHPEVR
jgi:hypothetical protein